MFTTVEHCRPNVFYVHLIHGMLETMIDLVRCSAFLPYHLSVVSMSALAYSPSCTAGILIGKASASGVGDMVIAPAPLPLPLVFSSQVIPVT